MARARPPRERPRPAPRSASSGSAWRALALPALGLLLVLGVAAALHRRPAPAAPAPSQPPAVAPRPPAFAHPAAPEAPRPTLSSAPLLPAPAGAPTPDAEALSAQAAQSDRLTASRLAEQITRGGPLTNDDVRAAEDLFARYPAGARELLEAVLVGAAAQAQQRRRLDEAARLLRRATSVAPASPRPWRALLALHMDAGDWTAAESSARSLAAARPDDAEAVRSLAYALLRQDRSREALEVLDSFLAGHEDAQAAAFRERIRRDQAPEGSLDERRLAHFHVRYDGEEHEEVGREVLRLLERHYATLVSAFDYRPASPVPVILLSRQSYYDATGAPAWAGGHYDSFDGRVRIPIAGLTASLTPDLEGTLLHELTHVFVADRSEGRAPREIQEGLAQLMEGKRLTTLLDADGLRALADGRIRGVAGFYLSSLALVEDLVAQRGQGGINDLLAAMADSGGADAAFRRVYGKDLAGLQADAAARLRARYGS